MTMENEDLENKIRDIQSMKVTREIQAVSCVTREIQAVSCVTREIQAVSCVTREIQPVSCVTREIQPVSCVTREIQAVSCVTREIQAVSCVTREIQPVNCVTREIQAVSCVTREIQAVNCVRREIQAVSCVTREIQAVSCVTHEIQAVSCVTREIQAVSCLTCTSSDSRIQRLIVCAAICYLDKWFAIVFDSMNELPIIHFPLIRVQAIPFIFGLVGMCLEWKLRTIDVVIFIVLVLSWVWCPDILFRTLLRFSQLDGITVRMELELGLGK